MATAPPSFGSSALPIAAPLPQPGPSAGEVLSGGAVDAAGTVEAASMKTVETNREIARIKYERNLSADTSDRAAALETGKTALEAQLLDSRDHAGPGGAGHVEAAQSAVETWKQGFLDSLGTNQELVRRMLPHVAAAASDLVLNEQKWVAGESARKQRTDYVTLEDSSSASAYGDYSTSNLERLRALGETAISAMPVNDDTKAVFWQSYKGKLAVGAWEGLKRDNPAAAVDALDHGALNDARFDSEHLNGLRQGAVALQEHRDALARTQLSQQTALFEQGARTHIEDVKAGVQVDPSMLQSQAAAAENLNKPDLAHDLRNAAAMAGINARFGPASQADKDAALRSIEARPDWQKNPQLVAAHTQLQSLIGRDNGRALNDKLGLWSENGGGLTPFNLNDRAAMQSRIAEARAAQQRYGGPLQVMTAAEAAPMKDAFAKGGPGDKATMIQTLSAYGPVTANAMLRQIAPLQPQYATLANLAGMWNHQAGGAIVRDALNGWEELKANKALIHGHIPGQMQADFNTQYGPALAMMDPVARQGIMDVAKGVYAARAARSGNVGTYDGNLWLQSIGAALGETGDGAGGFGTARDGVKFVLPRGASQGDFFGFLSRAGVPQIEAAAGHDAPMVGDRPMTLGEFKNLRPVLVGDDGRSAFYMFRSKSGFATSKAHPGQNFVVDMRALAGAVGAAPPAPRHPAAAHRPGTGDQMRSAYEALPIDDSPDPFAGMPSFGR